MHTLSCRYNLIEGELRIDPTNGQITFVRHSLGDKEVYATWDLTDVKKFEIAPGLLTQEIVIVLQSNEVLRFAANEIETSIKEWIENRKNTSSPKKVFSKPSEHLEDKSKNKDSPSPKRSKKKKKSKNKIVREESVQVDVEKKRPRTMQPNSFAIKKEHQPENVQDVSSTTSLLPEEKASLDSSLDTMNSDNPMESFNDIANIFREMKSDLISNQSSFEEIAGKKITHKINNPSSSLEEDEEQKGCCSNWILWLIAFLFLVQCLGN